MRSDARGARLGYEESPFFWPALGMGIAGGLVLLAGFVLMIYFNPVPSHRPIQANITGVFNYEEGSRQTYGSPQVTFSKDRIPAAVVDWSSVPSNMVVAAGWYEDDGAPLNRITTGTPGSQPDVVPLIPDDGSRLLPGKYTFAIGRYSGGRMLEVLAQRTIEITP